MDFVLRWTLKKIYRKFLAQCRLIDFEFQNSHLITFSLGISSLQLRCARSGQIKLRKTRFFIELPDIRKPFKIHLDQFSSSFYSMAWNPCIYIILYFRFFLFRVTNWKRLSFECQIKFFLSFIFFRFNEGKEIYYFMILK